MDKSRRNLFRNIGATVGGALLGSQAATAMAPPQITDETMMEIAQWYLVDNGKILQRFWDTCDKPLNCDRLVKFQLNSLAEEKVLQDIEDARLKVLADKVWMVETLTRSGWRYGNVLGGPCILNDATINNSVLTWGSPTLNFTDLHTTTGVKYTKDGIRQLLDPPCVVAYKAGAYTPTSTARLDDYLATYKTYEILLL